MLPSHSSPHYSTPVACPAPSTIPSPFKSSGLFDSTRAPKLSSLDPCPDDVEDQLEDSSTTPIIDIQHAIKYLLKAGGIIPSPARAFDPAAATNPSASATRFGRSEREHFALSLDKIDPRIRAKLDQPFGKDNLTQCFYAEPAFQHTFVLLLKTGFLSNSDWATLVAADPATLLFSQLFDQYAAVDFSPLQGYPQHWKSKTEVNQSRVAMTSAALLYFNGSVADVVRWVGGPHVAAHRTSADILTHLVTCGAPPDLLTDLSRIFNSGIPAVYNISATEANFQAYHNYGNHSSGVVVWL